MSTAELVAGVVYIGFLLLFSSGPLLFRVVHAAPAAVVVLTCHRWQAFALFASPFLIQLLVYDRQRVVSPAVTGRPIDATGPRVWELAWFGIPTAQWEVTPPEWFQSHTSPMLDFACGLTYLGFMYGFVLLAALFATQYPLAARRHLAVLRSRPVGVGLPEPPLHRGRDRRHGHRRTRLCRHRLFQ